MTLYTVLTIKRRIGIAARDVGADYATKCWLSKKCGARARVKREARIRQIQAGVKSWCRVDVGLCGDFNFPLIVKSII